MELSYGFKHIALQGRYFFPVLGIAYIFFTKILMSVSRKILRIPILSTIVLFYLFSGPLTFVLKYNEVFAAWMIK